MPSIVSPTLLAEARLLIHRFQIEEAHQLLVPFLGEQLPTPEGASPIRFWRYVGEALRDVGEPVAAERAWLAARDAGMAPYAAETEIIAGHMLSGRYAESMERLIALRETEPRNAVIRNLMAITLFESGEQLKALEEWESCRQFSAQTDCPLSTQPFYLSLGAMAIERYLLEQDAIILAVHTDSGEQTRAEKAPGRSPAKRMGQIERAWDEGRYVQALSWIDGEIAEAKVSPDLRMVRALVLGGLARWEEARKEIVAVLQENSKNTGAQSYLAYALIHSEEPGTALALLDRIEPAGPDDFFSNYIRGCGWIASGDRLRAVQAFHVAFSDYFFDSYHSILVPAWKRTVRLLRDPR